MEKENKKALRSSKMEEDLKFLEKWKKKWLED